jgi:hypothetical protein
MATESAPSQPDDLADFGYKQELDRSTALLLIILLGANITRGPDVLFETQGTGDAHDWGYFGAFLAASRPRPT